MKIKSIVAGMIAAVGFSTANATITDYLVDNNTNPMLTAGGSPYSFAGQVGSNNSDTEFLDSYLFTIASNLGLSASATIKNLAPGQFTLTLYQGSSVLTPITSTQSGSDSFSYSWGSLTTGYQYRLDVSGKDNKNVIGTYSGSLTVQAVPEPESYAMFLAGLGLMGVIARRRRVA